MFVRCQSRRDQARREFVCFGDPLLKRLCERIAEGIIWWRLRGTHPQAEFHAFTGGYQAMVMRCRFRALVVRALLRSIQDARKALDHVQMKRILTGRATARRSATCWFRFP